MSGVIFETEIRKFAPKDGCEMHDLCLFFMVLSCENVVSQRYVNVKGINISKAAFEIIGYSCCRLNQNVVFFFIKFGFKSLKFNKYFTAHQLYNQGPLGGRGPRLRSTGVEYYVRYTQ
jgi:hypothetical protein